MEKYRLIMPGEFELGKDFNTRLERVGEVIMPPDGTVLRKEDDNKVWLMKEGKRCWVTTLEVWKDMEEDLDLTNADILIIKPGWKYDPIALEDIPRGKDITEWPEEEETENPYRGMRGLLTLNPKPDQALVSKLGFNLIWLYAHKNPMHWQTWIKGGGKLVPCTDKKWSDEGALLLYDLSDEPDCHQWSPDAELEKYLHLKKLTEKPVGTLLCGDIGCGYGTENEWVKIINQMDFVALDLYPYRSDWPDPVFHMERCHLWWKEHVTVPIIVVIQAHWGILHLTRPNPMEQVKFWVEKGYGYVVYPWKDERNGVIDTQNEWKAANLWAQAQI